MRKLLKWLLALVAVAAFAIAALIVQVWYFRPLQIEWFYTRVFAEFALDHPEFLSTLRILPSWADFYSDKLDDASPAHDLKLAAMVRRNLDMLHRYDRIKLDREGQLSYDVLEYFLGIQAEGERFLHHDFPVNQMFGVQSTLPNFMAQVHRVTNEREADRYISRLRKFPIKFAQIIDGLKLRELQGIVPPQFTVEEVLKQMNGFVSKPPKENPLYVTFQEKIEKIPANKMNPATRNRLLSEAEDAIEHQVYPAYRQLIDYFVALAPRAKGNYGA